jgi:hypothetical protein
VTALVVMACVDASAYYKTKIVLPSMAMQVKVPDRHAPVSMLIRL